MQRKRWVPGAYATKREASEAEARALLARGRSTSRSGMLNVAEYAATWLDLHPRPKRSTMLHYQETVGRFVRSHGKLPLGSFDRRSARLWALEHRSQVAVVRSMFGDALRDGLISENPFLELRIQQSRGRRDLDVLSVGQVDELASIARSTFGPSFAAFILTAAYTGMRPGELYALRWPRVLFDRDEIEVAAQYSTRARETTAPKNGQQRTIVMFPEAKYALERIPREGDVVFRTLRGYPLDGASLSYYWNPVRIAAGRPGLDTYELRHFCAAHLLNTLGHEAEDVAQQLGHTDGGALVRKLYGHPSEDLARQRLKAGFGRKVRPLRAV